MRKAAIWLIMILALGLPVLAQAPTNKWKIVQVVQLSEQTAPIPPTTLFTPTTVKLYRITSYINCGGQKDGKGYWELSGSAFNMSCYATFGVGQTLPFSGKVGTPVTYAVIAGSPTPAFPYDLY